MTVQEDITKEKLLDYFFFSTSNGYSWSLGGGGELLRLSVVPLTRQSGAETSSTLGSPVATKGFARGRSIGKKARRCFVVGGSRTPRTRDGIDSMARERAKG